MRKIITFAVLATALAGCDQEAGPNLDMNSFGNATQNNELVMRGELDYAVSLGQRFAAEVPDTVNFDFDSAFLDADARLALDRQANWIRQFPEVRFRVYGHTDKLDGKYAQIVYREYVESATTVSTLTGSSSGNGLQSQE